MSFKKTFFIILSTLLVNYTVKAQDYELKITSVNKTENKILNKINYLRKFQDSTIISKELKKIEKELQKKGYYAYMIDSVKKQNKIFNIYVSLNKKVNNIIISFSKLNSATLKVLELPNTTAIVQSNKIEEYLNKLSLKLEQNGLSFSKIYLEDYTTSNKTIKTSLVIKNLKERKITNTIIKGYENFPTKYITNHYNINTKTIYNNKLLNKISKNTKPLRFIKEIKKPEILFTKDSTLLYMYLKKINRSSFDGLINFANNENGKIKFNGYLELNLLNIINKGEEINLEWKSLNNDRSEFSLNFINPYIFNSKISPEIKFNIYRQDSTFTNTRFETNLKYKLSEYSKISVNYTTETSTEINKSDNIKAYDNNFFGLGYEFTVPNYDEFNSDKFSFLINPSIGKRKTSTENTSQIKIESRISYLFNLNNRNKIHLQNNMGFLNSENYVNNELFRIGGKNTIRGVNEKSIFTENYITQNIEYRYLTKKNAYLYTISDLGIIYNKENSEKLFGIGIGYLFNTNKSKINFSITTLLKKKLLSTPENTQFTINWMNYL